MFFACLALRYLLWPFRHLHNSAVFHWPFIALRSSPFSSFPEIALFATRIPLLRNAPARMRVSRFPKLILSKGARERWLENLKTFAVQPEPRLPPRGERPK